MDSSFYFSEFNPVIKNGVAEKRLTLGLCHSAVKCIDPFKHLHSFLVISHKPIKPSTMPDQPQVAVVPAADE